MLCAKVATLTDVCDIGVFVDPVVVMFVVDICEGVLCNLVGAGCDDVPMVESVVSGVDRIEVVDTDSEEAVFGIEFVVILSVELEPGTVVVAV